MLNLKIIYFGEKRLGSNVDPKKYRVVPTYLIVIVLVLAVLSLAYEIYVWNEVSGLQVIEVGDEKYFKGEEEYATAMERVKSILTGLLWTSGGLSVLFGTWLFFRVRRGAR